MNIRMIFMNYINDYQKKKKKKKKYFKILIRYKKNTIFATAKVIRTVH